MDYDYYDNNPNNITYDADDPFEHENTSATKNYEQEVKELRLALDNQIKNILDLEDERDLLQRKNTDLQKYKVDYEILLESRDSAGLSSLTRKSCMIDQEIQTDEDEND